MSTETVRVRPHVHRCLKELAEQTGQSMTDVLEQAIEAFRRRAVLEETNRAFAALRKDPKAWRAELAERQAWEASLSDHSQE